MKKVLFFAPFGPCADHHQLDAVLAAALRLRGCEASVAGCDGILKIGELLACDAYSKTFGLPLLQLRDYLSPNDIEKATEWSVNLDVTSYATATYEGKPIGEWATSSVFSHFRNTAASLQLPEVRRVHQEYLVAALLTWIALPRMLDEFQADAMVIFNGRMAPYRVAFEVARDRGIRVLGLEQSVTPGFFTLYENFSLFEPQPVLDYIERWRQVPLNAADCAKCAAVTSHQTDAAEVRHTLDIPPDARILGVFTGSEFEMANNNSSLTFTEQLEYIDRLFEVFRERADYLLVRHHSDIIGDHDFIRHAWKQAQGATGNVRIIMPAEKLSTYDLIPHLSGAIAFFSSTVFESIARGVAAAALPEFIHHPAATLVIRDTSREGLAQLVDQLFAKTANFQPSDLRSCYRYLSASLTRHSSEFETDIRVHRVCDFLTDGAPIFDLPGDAEMKRRTDDEESFFKEQWTKISSMRRELNSDSSAMGSSEMEKAVAIVSMSDSAELPAWCARSRHRAIVLRGNVTSAGVGWERVLDNVKHALGKVTEDYVLLAGDGFVYDESFFGSAVRALEANTSLIGVTIGGWVARSDGSIDGELFTQQYPCREFYEACSVLPLLHEPHVGLSFSLIRTARVMELLGGLSSGLTHEETAARLFAALREPAFEQRLLPMAMIQNPPPSAVEIIDTHRETPVLFLIFNRPDLTQQVFEAIRAQRPKQLFVAADGPRTHIPAERARCDAARRCVLDYVDWDCEVKTLFRDENLGCKKAVSLAIGWFFDHVEEGIILEDDCLPGPDFFRFCGELLSDYRDNPSVMQIGGVNFQQGRRRGEASFYFSKYTHIWGWATWRRAWKHYDLEMAGLDDLLSSEAWQRLCPDPREVAYWEPILRRVRDGFVDTWDYQWNYTIWKQGGMVALPQVNLISNIGFRSDATHTMNQGERLANMQTRALGKIEFVKDVAKDEMADAFTFNTVFSPPGKSKVADPLAKAKKADKESALVKRITAELEAIKDSLAWKLSGKPLFSIEKRMRRLLGRERGDVEPTHRD